jgi:hypothetical protein
LLVHFEEGGRAHVIDVWDSVEAYERFVGSTLIAAISRAAAGMGLDPAELGQPEVKITDLVH